MTAWETTGFTVNTVTSNGPLPKVTIVRDAGDVDQNTTTEDQNPFTIVLVTWADAHAGDGGWLELEGYEDDGEVLVETLGFLVPADAPGGKKGHVTVWQSYHGGEGINPFHIPAGMVRNLKTLT